VGENMVDFLEVVSRRDAGRFLAQATFGPTPEQIARVQSGGIEAFLEDEFAGSPVTYPDLDLWPGTVPATCTGSCVRDNYTVYPLQQQFFRNAITGGDQLRQRVAFALSQILVVSAVNDNLRLPSRLAPYLRTLVEHAFGNFRDLLYHVTLNPAMGRFLDMAGNNRANPNENFARELLQLFTVGLHELHDDGTEVLDADGRPIPTFNEATVVAFSRAFTGWNFARAPAPGVTDYRSLMVLNQGNHDLGTKRLLGGVVLAANRNGSEDLDRTIDNVFHHHNVGPFLGRQLIQKLVTARPSPAYVGRVASAFNDNGAGVRGDMKAVVRAVLLDPEARAPEPPATFGKLREPVLAITSLLRAFATTEATSDFVLGDSFLPTNLRCGQDLFRAPSVFNYFPPGGELAIHSTATALARVNLVYAIVYRTLPTSADRPKGTWVDLAELEPLAGDPAALVAAVDERLLAGTMSGSMRAVVVERTASVPAADRRGRARKAVYLVASSAAYQVQR
jgi:uncharacterized protein (DUF1800 family)